MNYFKNHFSNFEWRFNNYSIDISYGRYPYTTSQTVIEVFSNLGFVDTDFTPIKLLENDSINLKWSKDTKNSFYCNLLVTDCSTSDNNGTYFRPCFSNGQIGPNFMPFVYGSESGNPPDPCLIFLPLSNDGFFINMKSHNDCYGGYLWPEPQYYNLDGYGASRTFKSLNTLFDFKNGEFYRGFPEGFDLICIPNSKNKNSFYYLYGLAGTSFFGLLNPTNYSTIYMDLGNKNVKTLIRRINYEDTSTDFILPNDYYNNYTNYTNQNDNNTCTLCNIYTKEEKEKINNLYYVINKPEQVNIRDMFTVNGRTFFYFCPPFAIELPNN